MASDARAFLQIQDIVKDFNGTQAVNHASVDIAQGEIFALLGPSGCGKSTLLRMLAGFETPTSGRILLGGVDLATLAPYERPMNMMFQSYALFPHLTVWENIAFGLKRESQTKDRIAERVEAMLKLVQLNKFAQRKPHQLSGGQQQRVALARSLAKRPQLLLLKDPARGLPFPDEVEIGMVCRGHCFREGLIMRAVGNRMIIAPPLVITRAQIDEMMVLIRRCLDLTLADARTSGWLD